MKGDLVGRLRRQMKCRRCDCLSCDREGMGELHDHVCTSGPDCIETPTKLRSRLTGLRYLSNEAADAITSLRTQLEAAQADKAEACDRAREEERDRLYEAWLTGGRNAPVAFWFKQDAMRPANRISTRSLSSSGTDRAAIRELTAKDGHATENQR